MTINTIGSSESIAEIVAANINVVITFANILERQKIQFKVSDRGGRISQSDLNARGYFCWLDKDKKFSGHISG